VEDRARPQVGGPDGLREPRLPVCAGAGLGGGWTVVRRCVGQRPEPHRSVPVPARRAEVPAVVDDVAGRAPQDLERERRGRGVMGALVAIDADPRRAAHHGHATRLRRLRRLGDPARGSACWARFAGRGAPGRRGCVGYLPIRLTLIAPPRRARRSTRCAARCLRAEPGPGREAR